MNFINREFSEGFHFVYPGDNAKSSACAGGAVAYVWRASARATTGYQETTGPRCRNTDNPMTKNCGLDQYGKHYVYLCRVWMQQDERYRVGVLVHEAAHHAGPNDVTGSTAQMKVNNQYNQVMNAANYENFAKTVVSGGCEDQDGNCRYYASYCNQANIKRDCKRTCGLCGSGGSSPPRRRSGGSGSGCVDRDGNCRHYTSYCDRDNIKRDCRRSCGLCGSGGSSPPRRRSGGCVDRDGNCRYYTS